MKLRTRFIVGVLAVALPGAGLATTAVALATAIPANASGWVPTELLPPAAQEVDSVASVSCPSAGNCTAVGFYVDLSSYFHALVFNEASGVWLTGTAATLPANAYAGDANSYLTSVSCASAGNCSAVGYYTDGSSNQQGLLLSETAGLWGTGMGAALPANAAGNPRVYLESVSCAAVGNCSAVGYYTDIAGTQQGLIIREIAGAWHTLPGVVLPANAGANQSANLSSVSCPQAGTCEAVGYYLLGSGNEDGLIVNETGAVWRRGVQAALPSNAGNVNGGSVSELGTVSCPPTGNCVAGGSYLDNSGNDQGLLINEYAGVEVMLPANAAAAVHQDAAVESVSCPSGGYCSAVGYYQVGSPGQQGVLLREVRGVWHIGVEAALPANASAAQHEVFYTGSVSCPSVGNCTAVGSFLDSYGAQALVVSEIAGVWHVGVEAALPRDARANPDAELVSVSCAPTGRCEAVGEYLTTSNFYGGGLVLKQ